MCFGQLGHGHFLSAILDFKFLYFLVYSIEVDLGVPKPRHIEPYTNQYTNFPIGYYGKLQTYKTIFKMYGLWFQNTLFI